MEKTAHVAVWKKETVKELDELVKKYPVIGVSDIEGFPANEFQKLRKNLEGKAVIKVAKSNLFKIVLKDNPRLKDLGEYLDRPTAFVFTEINPFKLFKLLKQNSTRAFARPGQTATEDIVVPEGDTGIPPGPVLGDLREAGIEARIAEGSIKVIRKSVVARKGEEITPEAALALTKLGIKPVELSLYLEAVIENGQLFTAAVLDISEEDTLMSIRSCHANAFNLAFNTGYPTKQNIELFVFTAFNNARNLGINAMILEKGVIEDLLAKAGVQATTLSSHVKEAPAPAEKGEEKPEEEEPKKEGAEKVEEKPKEEPKKEEKPKEEPKKEEAKKVEEKPKKEDKKEKPKAEKEPEKKEKSKKEKKGK